MADFCQDGNILADFLSDADFLADFYQNDDILRDFCSDDDFFRFISGMPTFLGDFNEDDQICLKKKTFFHIFSRITLSWKISKVLILWDFFLL